MSIFSDVLAQLRQMHAEGKVALPTNLQESATVLQSIVTTKGKTIGGAGDYDHKPSSNNAGLRELVSRYLRLQPEFQSHVQSQSQKIFKPGVQYSVVHVRLTDKKGEAKLNFELELDDMVVSVIRAAKDFGGCRGIFLMLGRYGHQARPWPGNAGSWVRGRHARRSSECQ